MRRIASSLLIASLICALSVPAFANEKMVKDHFTFEDDVLVDSTLVKKGNYLIKYSPETSEVSIMKGNKLVARAKASVIMHDQQFEQDAFLIMDTAAGKKLTALRPGGEREEIVILDGYVAG